jgi:hypothetical protein
VNLSIKTTDSLSTLYERLFALIKIRNLLRLGKRLEDEKIVDFELTLKNILQKGNGILTEIVSKYIVHNEIPPKLLEIVDMEEDSEEKTLIESNEFYRNYYGKF